MRELLELQTGQVAFISGLMSGFSLTIAGSVLRHGIRTFTSQAVFLLFLLSSLLFLVALYADVRLSIELAGVDELPETILNQISQVRHLGTAAATSALVIFVAAVGILGCLATPLTGVFSTMIAAGIFSCLWFVWSKANTISSLIASL